MADRDRTPDSIIGRDADAAGFQARPPQGVEGAALAEQLDQTTTEDAGGNVSGTATDAWEEFDIVFEHEDEEETRH